MSSPHLRRRITGSPTLTFLERPQVPLPRSPRLSRLPMWGVSTVMPESRWITPTLLPESVFQRPITPNTVLRGGYGISFFPGNYTSNADLKNAPFVSVYSPNCQSTVAVAIEGSQNINPASQNRGCLAANGESTTFDQGLPLPAAQTINSQSLSFVAEDPHFPVGAHPAVQFTG